MKILSTILLSILLTGTLLAQTDSLVLRPGPTSGKDAIVWSINSTNNYGNTQEATLTAWTYGGTPSTKRFYVEFDMSSIPAGTLIDSAYLFFYNNPTAPSHNGQHSGANSFEVKRVTNVWDEATITFANQPTSTNVNQVVVPATTSTSQNFEIDVTVLVQDQLTYGNNGFFLRLVNESTYRAIVCASSDHTVAGYRPMLKVYYPGCDELEAGFEETITNNTVQFTDTTSSSTAYSYYWDFGDGTFSYTQNPVKTYNVTGTYTVCLTVEDSCDIDTVCRTISLCNPAVPVISHYSTGLSIQFQGTPNQAMSYWWSFGDGNYTAFQNPLYTYSSGGYYQVCLAIVDSCGSDTTCTEIYVSGIGIDENSLSDIVIYPNPTQGVIHITGLPDLSCQVELYNNAGQLILELQSLAEKVDLSTLPSGVYVLKLKTQTNTISKRILKF